MAQLNSRLKASTLMESLIAMVIIIVCLGVATMIYSNVLDSDKQRLQLKAILVLNTEAIEIKAKKDFIDSEKQEGNWTIKKTIEQYAETKNIYLLSFVAIAKNGKAIAARNELIVIE